MNTIEIIKERYQQLQLNNGTSPLTSIEQNAFNTFNTLGVPTNRNEEWKYTRIGSVFNKPYAFNPESLSSSISQKDLDSVRFPGYEE
ncbi:MAG: Fe-S cluster assembly protein SufD, partial [Flavisolibacter sp.]